MNDREYAQKLIVELREAIKNKEDVDISLIGSIDLLETALVGTGLILSDDWETNGWEQDFWGHLIDENSEEEVAEVSGSMYYGDLRVTFNHEV